MIPKTPFGHHEEEGGGGEGGGMMRWLITYADLITLLLAFFIVLYALNQTQQIKFALVAKALADNLDQNGSIIGQAPGPSLINNTSGLNAATETAILKKLSAKLQQAINQQGLQNQVSILTTPDGLLVRLQDTLLFPSASAALAPSAVTLLTRVGELLGPLPNQVEVSGYTDSNPINTAQYPSNWQLSAMRAANVTEVLANASGNPGRFFASGFSQYQPVATNATAGGRQENRHVDILILTPAAAKLVLPSNPKAAPP